MEQRLGVPLCRSLAQSVPLVDFMLSKTHAQDPRYKGDINNANSKHACDLVVVNLSHLKPKLPIAADF